MSAHSSIYEQINTINNKIKNLLTFEQRAVVCSKFLTSLSPEKASTIFDKICIDAVTVKNNQSIIFVFACSFM